ncbi:MAG: polysaccharide biosynthesis protein, partial [Gammaproteobacteria bacterium]
MKAAQILSIRFRVILHDLAMATVAWVSAWWIRYNLAVPFPGWEVCLYTLPIVVVIQAILFRRFNLYRGLWRFASL